jgi:segregation and condensation protein B
MSEPLTPEQARAVIEAVLLSADSPVAATRLAEVVDGHTPRDLAHLVDELRDQYQQSQRGFTIVEVAGGYQLATRPELSPWLRRFHKDRAQVRLSQAALEALAIIAFKQPVTRIEIDSIRGVNSSGVMQTLLEVGMIRLVGRSEGIGKPMLFGTTREFLIHFGLKSLAELPRPRELEELLAEGEQKARARAGSSGGGAAAGSTVPAAGSVDAVTTPPPDNEWTHADPEAATEQEPGAGDELPPDDDGAPADDAPAASGDRRTDEAAAQDEPDAGDELPPDDDGAPADDAPAASGDRRTDGAAAQDEPDAGDELPLDDDGAPTGDAPTASGDRRMDEAPAQDEFDASDELPLDDDGAPAGDAPTASGNRRMDEAAAQDEPDASDELPLDDDGAPADDAPTDGHGRGAAGQP